MRTICFIIDELSNGGSERVVSILSNNLNARGYKVSIVTLRGNKNDYYINNNIKIIPFNKNNKSKIKISTLYSTVSFLRKTIKNINPDVIISFDSYNNILSVLSNFLNHSKLVLAERNDPNQYPNKQPIRKLRNLLYNFPDKVIFQTYDAMKYFNRRVQDKGAVIPNPITNNLPYWKEGLSEKTIISASRLSRQKNLYMMIDAFEVVLKKHPDYQLKIFGRGPLEEEIREYICNKGLSNSIKLMGFSNKIHSEIAKSSIFVLTSDYEGISNSMIEALGIGIPVISTDSPIGGARMFIKNNKNGILIKVGDKRALINSIEKILSDEKLAISLSRNATGIRNSLNESRITEEWIKVIEDI